MKRDGVLLRSAERIVGCIFCISVAGEIIAALVGTFIEESISACLECFGYYYGWQAPYDFLVGYCAAIAVVSFIVMVTVGRREIRG